MSRRYHHHKTYQSSNRGSNLALPLVIFLAYGFWVNQGLMLQVEHMAKICLFVGIGAVCAVMFVRLFKKVRSWSRKRNPNMAIIDHMTGLEFENYVARLLKTQGYRHIRSTEKYDYGVDIIATKDGVTWGIQVKRYSGLVKADAVRQVVTALKKYECDRAMVITNSTYSRIAKELARINNCVLLDRNKLVPWIIPT